MYISWGFGTGTPGCERSHFCHIVAGVYKPVRAKHSRSLPVRDSLAIVAASDFSRYEDGTRRLLSGLRGMEVPWHAGEPVGVVDGHCEEPHARRAPSRAHGPTFAPELGRFIESEWTLAPTVSELFAAHTIEDDLLRMMFSCCQPRLPEEAQVALVLNILCGFSVDEVANAFVSTHAATEKRIARAKKVLGNSKRLFGCCGSGRSFATPSRGPARPLSAV
jgi:hypothetical protein